VSDGVRDGEEKVAGALPRVGVLFSLLIIVALPVAEKLFLLGDFEGLGVIEGEEPFDNDDVGDAVTVILLVAVLEKEAVNEELDVTVLELDDEAVGVGEEEDVIDIVTLSDLLGDTGALGLLLTLAPRERLDVGL
jgi:hypothetical protein